MLRVLPGCAIARLAAPDAETVLRVLAGRLEDGGAVGPGFTAAVLARERAFPTGLPTPVPAAIPHADAAHVRRPGIAVATLARPVPFGAMGGAAGAEVAVELVVMLALGDASEHLAALQRLMSALGRAEAVRELVDLPGEAALAARTQAWLDGEAAGG